MGEVTGRGALLPALAAIPGHVLWRASAQVAATAAEVVGDDVDLVAYAALDALGDGGDGGCAGATQQGVAESIAVSRTTMVKVAGDLVDAGLVARVRDPDDRRSYSLTRTRAGVGAVRRWSPRVDALERAVTSPLSGAERERLLALLRRVAEVGMPDLPAAVRDRVALLVVRVHAWLFREFSAALVPVGVEPRHVGSLAALTALGPVPQVELARAIGVTPASAVAIVDGLERRGLVSRERAAADRRTQELHLSDAAPGVLADAGRAGRRTASRLLVALDAREREEMLALLRRLVVA